jgi:hypothetical protein
VETSLIIHTLATNYGPSLCTSSQCNTPSSVMLGIQAQELLILEVQPAINFISESVTEFQQDETVFIVGHEFS